LGTTPTEFARQIDVPPNRVSQIIAGKRSITGDTALRFGRWFGTDPQFWLNLQVQFDLAAADRQIGRSADREGNPPPAQQGQPAISSRVAPARSAR
jgi:antitoxin HigA-1